ncbi:MAG: hypothetical protein NT120_01520 [Candidatus Aenigmarchaeota archaeon]|nr:hypothetical protein [Candidatus Aenigmarchaeota archaeon]
MKGIIDIEFILSVVVFLSTISFVAMLIINNIPVFHGDSVSEDLRARAYQISQVLIFDKGAPEYWTVGNVLRVGLSNGTKQTMNTTKIANLASLCSSSYENTKSLLGQDYRTDIKIKIIDAANQTLLDCKPQVISLIRPEFQIIRFANLDDKRIVRIAVSVL